MILKIILFVLWVYALTVLKRGKLGFYYFLVGSVGTFFVLLNFMPYVKDYFIYGFVWVLGGIGDITGMYESYAQYGMFFINHNDKVMSLLAFFPAYKPLRKIITGIVGVLYICVFNFIRIYTIIWMIFCFGTPVYSLAHAIVGRIVFYVLTLCLYFYVFTRHQVIGQKVGKFSYENLDDKQ